MNNCIVARETAAHYASMAASDAIDEAVEQYAQDIMPDHLAPCELEEALYSLNEVQWQELSDFCKSKNDADAGKYIRTAAFLYWQNKSEEEAEENRDDIMGAIMERKR